MTRLLAIFGVLVISFSAVFVRLAGVSPDTAAFFRAAYALPFLVLLRWRLDPEPLGLRTRLACLGAGAMFGLDLAFWHRAIEWIGAGLATVLGNTQVVFVGLAAWILLGEKPRKALLLGTPIVFAGMVLVTGLGRQDAYGENPILGGVFGLLTGITYTTFLLLLRRATRDHESPVGPFLDVTLGAAVTAALVGLAAGHLDLAWSWPAHGWLIALAAGSQVVGWLFITHGLPRLPALETSVLLLLQPMATVLWGYWLFAEHLSTLQWSGVVLVLAGIGLPALRSRRARTPQG